MSTTLMFAFFDSVMEFCPVVFQADSCFRRSVTDCRSNCMSGASNGRSPFSSVDPTVSFFMGFDGFGFRVFLLRSASAGSPQHFLSSAPGRTHKKIFQDQG